MHRYIIVQSRALIGHPGAERFGNCTGKIHIWATTRENVPSDKPEDQWSCKRSPDIVAL